MSVQRGVLPTLTEVIEIDAAELPQRLPVAPLPPESIALENPAPPTAAAPMTTAPLPLSLAVAPRLDAADPNTARGAELSPELEARIQTLLAPRLARLVDTTLASLRTEVALQVQVLVRQAVDEALAERRDR